MTAGNSGMYNFSICNSFSKNCSINSEYLFILIITRERVQYMYIVPYLSLHLLSVKVLVCITFLCLFQLVFVCVFI